MQIFSFFFILSVMSVETDKKQIMACCISYHCLLHTTKQQHLVLCDWMQPFNIGMLKVHSVIDYFTAAALMHRQILWFLKYGFIGVLKVQSLFVHCNMINISIILEVLRSFPTDFSCHSNSINLWAITFERTSLFLTTTAINIYYCVYGDHL